MNIWAIVIIRAMAGGIFSPFSRISNHNFCHYSYSYTWAGGCSRKYLLVKGHLCRQLGVPCQPWDHRLSPSVRTPCSHHSSGHSINTPKRVDRRGCPRSRRSLPPVRTAWKSRNPRFCQALVWHATGENPYENQTPQANCQFQSSKP